MYSGPFECLPSTPPSIQVNRACAARFFFALTWRPQRSVPASLHELQGGEIRVQPATGHEFSMCAHVDDASAVHHHDAVGALHSGESMGDDEGGAPLHGLFERGLHSPFALRVERAGGFVQQQQRGVLQNGAGDADALALSAGQAHAAFAQIGVVALRQFADESVRLCRAGGLDHLVVGGLGPAVADVVHRAGGKDDGVLRHQPDAPAQFGQTGVIGAHAVDAHRAVLRVIEAQQQLQHRGLARAAGTDEGDGFAGLHAQRKIVQRRLLRARGVGEADMGELHCRSPGRGRQGLRLQRVGHGRTLREQFHQALGGARGAQQIAEDFGQGRGGSGHQADVQHGLTQRARAHAALDHGHRAEIQAIDERTEQRDDDKGGQQGAHAAAPHGRGEGGLGGVAKAAGFVRFARVALHRGHGVENLGGDGAGVGDPVLAGARQSPHPPADGHGGQHHEQDDGHDGEHQARAGGHQHDHAAQEHHGIAQPHRQAGPHDGLHQGGVGRQARQHLAGLRAFEELRALPQHMGVDPAAQIGRDPLAQPAHHVVARRREKAQQHGEPEEPGEMDAQGCALAAGGRMEQAAVDQPAQREREAQGAARGEQQEQQGKRDAGAIRAQERQQLAQRAQGALAGQGGEGWGIGHAAS